MPKSKITRRAGANDNRSGVVLVGWVEDENDEVELHEATATYNPGHTAPIEVGSRISVITTIGTAVFTVESVDEG